MASNAYFKDKNSNTWLPLEKYDSEDFGWNGNSIQGHIFISQDANIVVISLKGTSPSFFGLKPPSAPNDKLEDNKMFSCCCANVDKTWTPICGCMTAANECSVDCLRKFSKKPDSYLWQVESIYFYTKKHFPGSKIFVTGHSLGGALASLLANKYPKDVIAVAYGSPGEAHYAYSQGFVKKTDREHLPIIHVGHKGDPLFNGTCNGIKSTCYLAGYAMETKTHLGQVYLYDLGCSENVLNHRMSYYIENIVNLTNEVPLQHQEDDVDCENWVYV